MKLVRTLLFPIVPVYYVITRLRNLLYDLGIKKSTSYKLPIICVGNLSVGGTGKTPMIEYLINLLKDDFKVATLSRGYKRKTKGFQLANETSNVESIGDEPLQFYNKFQKDVIVAVDADRNNGIKNLQLIDKAPEVVLLDDAFQHRKVKAGFNIVLTTFNKPYFKDFVLPTGNLREPRRGAKRADVIVVTKCPDNLNEHQKAAFLKCIAPEEHQNVFFSSIKYADKVYSETSFKVLSKLESFTLVTGIANATPMVNFLKGKGLKFNHLNFNDHHDFTQKEIEMLEKEALIITTEKDFMRLKHYQSLVDKLYYLPIKVSLDNEKKFNALITDFVT